MGTVLTVLKAIVEILAKQNDAILALQREAQLDNDNELKESDFADLNAKLSGLTLPDSLG